MAEELFTDIINNLGKSLKKAKQEGKLQGGYRFADDGKIKLGGGYYDEDKMLQVEIGKDGGNILFKKRFADGGRAGYAAAGLVDPKSNVIAGQELGDGIKQKITNYTLKDGTVKKYLSYRATVGSRGSQGYAEKTVPTLKEAKAFRKEKLASRGGLFTGGKETVTWEAMKIQPGFTEYMDDAIKNNVNLKQSMRSAGLNADSPKEKIFKQFKKTVSEQSAVGRNRIKKVRGRRLPDGSFDSFIQSYKKKFLPKLGSIDYKKLSQDLPVSAGKIKEYIYGSLNPDDINLRGQDTKTIMKRSRATTGKAFKTVLDESGAKLKRVGGSWRIEASPSQIEYIKNNFNFNLKGDGSSAGQFDKFTSLSKKTPEYKKRKYSKDLTNMEKLVRNLNNKIRALTENGTNYKPLRDYLEKNPKLKNLVEATFRDGEIKKTPLNEIPDKELFEIIEKPDGRKYAKGKVVFQADHIQGRETVIYDKKTKKFIRGGGIEYPKNFSIIIQNINNNVKRSVENWSRDNPNQKKKITALKSWFKKSDLSFYDKTNNKIVGAKPTNTSTDTKRIGINLKRFLTDNSIDKSTNLPVITEGKKLLNEITKRHKFLNKEIKIIKEYSKKTGIPAGKLYSILGGVPMEGMGIKIPDMPDSVKKAFGQISKYAKPLLRGVGKAAVVLDPIFMAMDASEAIGKGATAKQAGSFAVKSLGQDLLNLPNVLGGATKYASDYLQGKKGEDLNFDGEMFYKNRTFADESLEKDLSTLTKSQKLRNIAQKDFDVGPGASMRMVDDMDVSPSQKEITEANEKYLKNQMGPYYKYGIESMMEEEPEEKPLQPYGIYGITSSSNEV